MSATDLRVAIADDQHLVWTGFRMILDAEPGYTVVGEAADGLAAVNLVAREEPDVVLVDIRMPHLDGIEATRRITASGVATRILVVTTFVLGETTVKTHVGRVLTKLEVRDRVQAVVWAYEHGVARPGAGPPGPGASSP